MIPAAASVALVAALEALALDLLAVPALLLPGAG